MRLVLSTFLTFFGALTLSAQHNINFEIRNYENDTLVVGYYVLDKQLVHDTLIDTNRKFALTGEENLQSGTYMLLTLPDQGFIQFLVNPKEQDFTVKFDYNQKDKVSYENSRDNSAFQSYVDFLSDVRPVAQVYRDSIAKLKEAGQDFSAIQTLLSKIDALVKEKQESMIAENPDFVSSQMIKANMEIIVPDFSDSEDPDKDRFEYYKEHYLDNIDFNQESALRSPYLHGRVMSYIERLTVNHPDSVKTSLDYILNRMKPQPETFKFYLSHLLNTYSASKIIGYDAVYVHLVDNYYAKGLADWVEEEQLGKIIDKANKIRPTLIGKIGADIKLNLEDGSTVKISEIDYEYLVLLFWAPDCGHCKKQMPKFVEFNEKWAPKGVKTLAVCSKLGEKEPDCWDILEEKNMLGFINATDKFHQSRFKLKYNVTKTPKVFILDKNREILIKDIGAEQLESVMDEIIRIKKEEDAVVK